MSFEVKSQRADIGGRLTEEDVGGAAEEDGSPWGGSQPGGFMVERGDDVLGAGFLLQPWACERRHRFVYRRQRQFNYDCRPDLVIRASGSCMIGYPDCSGVPQLPGDWVTENLLSLLVWCQAVRGEMTMTRASFGPGWSAARWFGYKKIKKNKKIKKGEKKKRESGPGESGCRQVGGPLVKDMKTGTRLWSAR